jgi:hypothetical protein
MHAWSLSSDKFEYVHMNTHVEYLSLFASGIKNKAPQIKKPINVGHYSSIIREDKHLREKLQTCPLSFYIHICFTNDAKTSLHDGSFTTTYGWLLKALSMTYSWSLKIFSNL